ncbi:hypothetical protein RFI_19151, partial [Reticulomyxa filosa]
ILILAQQVFFRKVIRMPISTNFLTSMNVILPTKNALIPTYQSGAAYDPDRNVIWMLGGYTQYQSNNPTNLIQYWDVLNNTAGLWNDTLTSACTFGINPYSTIYRNSILWFATLNGLCQYKLHSNMSEMLIWPWPDGNQSNNTAMALSTILSI